FGLAMVREDNTVPVPTAEGISTTVDLYLTRKGAIMGTLPYMSPEQWGKDTVDHRTDLWAVGIMLYELVVGRHPVSPLDFPNLKTLAAVLDEPMPSVSKARPDVGALGAVIDRCLKKHKAERIASAAELCAALKELLPGQKAFELGDGGSPFTGLSAFQEA